MRASLIRLATCCWCLLTVASSRAADTGVRTDRFGITELNPTAENGREWFAQWELARTVSAYGIDSRDPLFRNEEGVLKIDAGVATAPAGMTRFNVLTPTNSAGQFTQSPWRNVEMTIYLQRGAASRTVDWQAFYLSARSGWRHDDSVPCEGTSYHATLRFDGTCGFKKELWHSGGYTQLRPDPAPKLWPTVPMGRWIGMKFICRNAASNSKVTLQIYLDSEERNGWKLVSEFTDAGGWRGEKPGCHRAQDAVIAEARPVVYFRTDFVGVELKKFSVREIAPLP